MYYNVCEYCGANLDPGERCDCQDRKKKQEEFLLRMINPGSDGQMAMKEALIDDPRV